MTKWIATVAGAAMAAAAGAATGQPAGVVYVPLGSDNEIAVIDVATDRVEATISGLTAVHGLAGTPDGRYLIAGSYEARPPGTPAPDRPSAISEEEHEAHHSAAPPTDASAEISTVSVIDRQSGAVVWLLDVPGVVHHVAVSPDGRFAVVTHPQNDGITAIGLQDHKIVATLPTGPLANYAVFSPDSRTVYVSNAGNGTVSAVDTERWIVKWNVVVGSSPEHVVASPDGQRLYVNNVDDGTVSVVDTAAQSVEATFPIGATLHGIDLADDGRTLFVAALGDDKLAAIDLASGSLRSVGLAPLPYHLAVVRGAGKIYVSSADEPKIWVIDAKSLKVAREIAISGKGHQMVQVPGG